MSAPEGPWTIATGEAQRTRGKFGSHSIRSGGAEDFGIVASLNQKRTFLRARRS
jgi:hypothetical protein